MMMMKLVVLFVLPAVAVAFAPSASVSKTTQLHEFANGYVGGDGPEPFLIAKPQNFDPAGFCDRAPEWIPWFREAELKNGRVAMLATLGMVVPDFVRIPGDAYSFEAIPRVLDAHDALPDSMIQIFGWISFLEAVTFPAIANMKDFDRAPGDFGFDPLKLYPKTAEGQKAMQIKELKNGRLAMIAIGGMIAGSLVTGKPFPYI